MPKLELSHASFVGSVKAVDFEYLEELGISKASFMSEAKPLIPQGFDPSNNMDVMPIVFNLAVVNKFNQNGDGISSRGAAKILKQFINRPINTEHKKNLIVGHIINASFSNKQPDFLENDVLDFIDIKDPFYITAAGLIYKHVYPKLADAILEASNPEDPNYKAYATSWEIAFNEYDIAVGSEDLKDCSIYSEGSEEFSIMKPHLKAMGGKGVCEMGRPVNRLLKGKKYPVGCALTENPAADVEGVYTLDSLLGSMESEYENKSSQNSQNNVIDTNDIDDLDMTDEQFKEIMERLEALASVKGNKKEESLASGFEEIKNILKQEGQGWKSQAEKNKEGFEAAQKELEELKEKFSTAEKELNYVKEEMAIKESAALYNERMDSIASLFDLNEAEEKIVANKVKDIDSEKESFDNYVSELKVLMSPKLRANMQKAEEEAEASKEEVEASKEEVIEDNEIELENSDSSETGVTNNNGEYSEEKTLIERVRENGLALS